MWDSLWINARLVTMEAGSAYGLIDSGAIATQAGRITWVGNYHDLPDAPKTLAKTVHDVQGRCITPAFIDSHTHLVYGGNRSHEFEQRLQGVSYEEITRAGGGIQSTVNATRALSEEKLLETSLVRAKAMMANGVATIEIKSGYGLDLETELKILRVAKRIGELLPVTIHPTFLGAHLVPKEFQDNADGYIDYICQEILPTVVRDGLAETVDVFCEKIAFNLAQTEKVFAAAEARGLQIKCHAEQLSQFGATELAAKYQALSVDHLEFLTEAGVKALAASKTVAVLLPGAFYFLREKQLPPIDLLRAYQIPIAIATDCNPGTSPTTSLLLMLNMACTLFRLTPEEALQGVTINAAKALGFAAECGTLTVGKRADLAIWDVEHPVELVYAFGSNPLISLHTHKISEVR